MSAVRLRVKMLGIWMLKPDTNLAICNKLTLSYFLEALAVSHGRIFRAYLSASETSDTRFGRKIDNSLSHVLGTLYRSTGKGMTHFSDSHGSEVSATASGQVYSWEKDCGIFRYSHVGPCKSETLARPLPVGRFKVSKTYD